MLDAVAPDEDQLPAGVDLSHLDDAEPPLAAAEALVGDCGGDWCSSASEARGDTL